MRAQDLGVPSNFNTTLVTITVSTNFQRPRLIDTGTYSATIPETTSLGEVLMTIQAEDTDQFVSPCVFALTRKVPKRAP